MSNIWPFDNIENKHTLHRGEDYEKFLLPQMQLILKRRKYYH